MIDMQKFFSLCLLLAMPFLFVPDSAQGIQLTIKKNMSIRKVTGSRAVKPGGYVIKAGSVIEIPDKYVVLNSIGGVDLRATLQNWQSGDSLSGIYSLGRGKGKEAFFRLNVIKAAPGSKIPSEFDGVVALDFLRRRKALFVASDELPANRQAEKTKAETVLPPPKPSRSKPARSKRPTPPKDSLVGTGSASGGTQGKLTPSPPSPSPSYSPSPQSQGLPPSGGKKSKQEILRPVDTPENNVKVFEPPKPTPKPHRSHFVAPQIAPAIPGGKPPAIKPADVVAKVEAANAQVSEAGNPEDVCPDGACEASHTAGVDVNQVCKQFKEGDFPESLNKLSTSKKKERKRLKEAVLWAYEMIRNPKKCSGSCDEYSKIPAYKLLFNQGKSYHSAFCDEIKNCPSKCTTSKVLGSTKKKFNGWKCGPKSRAATKYCAAHCSPTSALTKSKRQAVISQLYQQATQDLKTNKPSYAKKMKTAGVLDNMHTRLLCLNLRRENVTYDPLARPCKETAIGLGQVNRKTFLYSLGLANKRQQRKCIHIKIKDLKSKCKGWDHRAYRRELYIKYEDLTPEQLFDRRATDIELQARSNYAVFVDKLRIGRFNLNRSYKFYFGKSDTKARKRIERCVKTGGV